MEADKKIEPYWTVLEYAITDDRRYPLQMFVLIKEDNSTHFWKLPKEQIGSDQYDWSKAVKKERLFEGV